MFWTYFAEFALYVVLPALIGGVLVWLFMAVLTGGFRK
jgi:hypothetical protein